MTGEEMLRELETKARAQALEDGRKEGREEAARRMVRLESARPLRIAVRATEFPCDSRLESRTAPWHVRPMR